MRATLAALCLLTGCRQVLGLEPSVLVDAGSDGRTADGVTVDAATGCGASDFDGDGVSDGCDLCPHVASTAADTDNDGVGDLCDPNLGNGGDKRALWLTFESPTAVAGWSTATGTWTVSNGSLHALTNSLSTLDSPIVYPPTIDFVIRMTIVQPSTNDVGFCAAGYCCTVANDPGSKTVLKVANLSIASTVTMSPALVAGDQVDLEGFTTTSTQQFKCRLRRGTTGVEVSAPVTGSTAEHIQFYAEAPVDYRYVFVVTPGP